MGPGTAKEDDLATTSTTCFPTTIYPPYLPFLSPVLPVGAPSCSGVVIVFAGIGFEMRGKYQRQQQKSAGRNQGDDSKRLLSLV